MSDMLAVSVFWKTLPIVVIVVGVCIWAIRRFKLPFVPRVYFTTLGIVAVLVAIAWALVFKLTDYEIMPADYGGTVITTLIFAYLVHLWIIPIDEGLPEDYAMPEDDGAVSSSPPDRDSDADEPA